MTQNPPADTAAEPSPADATPPAAGYRPLRIWPALLLLVAGIAARVLPDFIEEGPRALMMIRALGPVVCAGLILLWWLLASRATWQERVVGFVGVILAFAITMVLVDESMQQIGPIFLTIPMGGAAFAIGALLCSRTLSFRRTVIATLLAACGMGFSTALRNDGMWGNFALGLHWRWEPSPEERLLANKRSEPQAEAVVVTTSELELALASPEWPAFRGADRTGRQSGAGIVSDWATRPPEELWRVDVGPGWSSFVVAGSMLFTQEQRGPMETVVCYDADTGQELWTQQVESRFDDPLGGPGPRATPTLADGALFVMGAEGLLLRLDPRNGDLIWKQDLREAADRDPPMWGFSSSPLVVEGVAVVHAGGAGDKGTFAFDAETGQLRWSAAAGDHSYSSPHLCELGNDQFILMLTNTGMNVLDPVTGADQLNYEWAHEGYRSLQPQLVEGDSILLPTGIGAGTRRIRITSDNGTLTADEQWTSRDLEPDFNDFVVYQGHAYGLDAAVFTCVDLATGDRMWKRGRYGKGQVLLLEDPGLLLVVSETGEVVLLEATPSAHTELARIQALEGKTWNHPVLIGDRLYLRNSQEAACYRLPSVSPPEPPETTTAVSG